ncbi:G-type lectin S-receptor-like serine/threonine-protein kinase SD2-5 isoform X1 [Triticum urartu]|nr:G-type lectin S-receptor-like serine/threonine-protein kinase SD2-5 isoform X1 [Triticum urartu]
MYPPKILILLLVLPLTFSSSRFAMSKSFALNVELGTIWRNDPSLLHNISPDDNFSLRIILPMDAFTTFISGSYDSSIPSFACGFFCAGAVATCDDYIFSIFFVSVYSFKDVVYLNSPEVVWSANRDRPVKENASVQLTELGDLVLFDADGTLVWSTNTTEKSVAGMNLTSTGNLVLLNHANMELWRSFDHPTDTLVTGQVLQEGQKLMASTSMTNWASGKFYLTALPDGMHAFAGTDTPLSYYQSPTGGTVMTNRSAYVALKNGSLEVFTCFRDTEAPDYQIQLPRDDYGLVFVRLEFDGHLRLYQMPNNSWLTSDVFDITDPCAYPLACGEYGICSNGQCSCPDAAIGQSGLFELIDPREPNRGCSPIDSVSCDSSQKPRLLSLPNITRFNGVYNWTTSEERCKLSCLNDCSCRASFFQQFDTSTGYCFLASDIFSMIDANSPGYSSNFSSLAFVKVNGATRNFVLSQGKLTVALAVGSSTFIALVVVAVLVVLRRNRAGPLEDDDIIDQLPGLPARFSFMELKSATEDFSKVIGKGGSGSVFEGQICDRQVAVKRLDGINQGKREFLAEVQTIGSINHIYLVRLIGFCAEKSHRLLVYEYMPNGSLDRWIFQRHQEAPLDWKTRLRIITDVARGLAYLHSDCRETIVHLDIKPQNILLDEQFTAKVSDFGLAKLIDREQGSVMTRLRSTPGYLAPEWLTSVINEKVDVYSFGIVIMEIICGRSNLDYSQPEESCHLVSMLQDKAKNDQLLDLIDPRSADMQCHLDEVSRMMNLAMWCLQVDSRQRPSMTEAVKILDGTMDVETELDLDLVNIDLMVANRAVRGKTAATLQIDSVLSGPR